MADEFLEHDLDTPTEADLDLAYGSKYLSVADIGDRRVRTRITKVRKEELQGNSGTKRIKFVLYFNTLDKPIVVNSTNKEALVGALGRTPANWIGATVGVFVEPTTFQGRPTKGLRLRVLEAFKTEPAPKHFEAEPAPKPALVAAEAEFNDEIPF